MNDLASRIKAQLGELMWTVLVLQEGVENKDREIAELKAELEKLKKTNA